MRTADEFERKVLELRPHLLGFARHLTFSVFDADDLIQTTMEQAFKRRHQFQEDTNLKAWLCKILLNSFRNTLKRKKREVEDPDGMFADMLMITQAPQIEQVAYKEVCAQIALLTPKEQVLLRLAVVEEVPYEDLAEQLEVALGTVKSRVKRTRDKLKRMTGESVSAQSPTATPVLQCTVPSSGALPVPASQPEISIGADVFRHAETVLVGAQQVHIFRVETP